MLPARMWKVVAWTLGVLAALAALAGGALVRIQPLPSALNDPSLESKPRAPDWR